ncbi:MAG: helix-turn-helix domain-containing protein [Dinoroseobacter sp.]|nr:helix-turn-helix domain-containing protein [Dinoroseobacter sp.]
MVRQTINRFEWAKAILQDESLSPTTKNVGVALALKFANDTSGQLNPTQETLADYVKAHKDSIKRAFRELRNGGWLLSLGNGGRSRAPMLKMLAPPNTATVRSSITADKRLANTLKGDEKRPTIQQKRRSNKQQKSGQNTPPQYKEQSLEQAHMGTGVRERFKDRRFPGNGTDGVQVLLEDKHCEWLNKWEDWLRSHNLPQLSEIPVSYTKQARTYFFLPYQVPPKSHDHTANQAAFEYFAWAIDNQNGERTTERNGNT